MASQYVYNKSQICYYGLQGPVRPDPSLYLQLS